MLVPGMRVSFTFHRSGWVLLAILIAFGWRDLGLRNGIIGALLVTLSLVIHELAHAAVAMLLQVPVREIGVKIIGAYTRRRYARRRLHDVLVAAAGPLASLLLMFASFFVPRIGVWLAEWNCGIALTNLLPLPGTDGYRILKTIFWPDASIYGQKPQDLSAPKVPEPA